MGALHYIKSKFTLNLGMDPETHKLRKIDFEPGYYRNVANDVASHPYFKIHEDVEKAQRSTSDEMEFTPESEPETKPAEVVSGEGGGEVKPTESAPNPAAVLAQRVREEADRRNAELLEKLKSQQIVKG